jgi:hypothetical protein
VGFTRSTRGPAWLRMSCSSNSAFQRTPGEVNIPVAPMRRLCRAVWWELLGKPAAGWLRGRQSLLEGAMKPFRLSLCVHNEKRSELLEAESPACIPFNFDTVIDNEPDLASLSFGQQLWQGLALAVWSLP